MEIKTGYLYHIKEDYFKKVNEKELMINHDTHHTRPTYFTIKDGDILWFIPLSSKIEKYKKLIEEKTKKYGTCKTIIIKKILYKDTAILIQNAFPVLEKYIDHIHMINGKPAKVTHSIELEILNNFKYLIKLKKKGKNLFFTNIDKLKEIMIEEIKK